MKLANPGQYLLTIAEQGIGEGQAEKDIAELAALAEALGARSPRVVAFLTPPPTAAPEPPATPVPSPAPVPAATATQPPRATDLPATSAPTAAPAAPAPAAAAPTPNYARVVGRDTANLRAGPGTSYPVVGQIQAEQEVEITGRSTAGDWWQLRWSGTGQAWVSGAIVSVLGPTGSVAVAANIPTPRPTATPAPTVAVTARPTSAPAPTAKPAPTSAPAGVDYRIVEQRLLGIHENGECLGNHNIYVQVVDPGGAPINGATVSLVHGPPVTMASGVKDCRWHIGVMNEGCATFELWSSTNQVQVIADPGKGGVTSQVSRSLSSLDQGIPNADLIAGGYCSSEADCAWRKDPGGGMPPQLCNGHYSWFVKFQRTW